MTFAAPSPGGRHEVQRGRDEMTIRSDNLDVLDLIGAAADLYGALAKLDALLDFGNDVSKDRPLTFEDFAAINDAFGNACYAMAKAQGNA